MSYEGPAIRYHETGNPADVLRAETIQYPAPKAGEVLIKLLAAPIHPSDFGMIGGSYGKLRELPAVAGREGVGEVVAVGEGVNHVGVGAHVRMPEDAGVWQAYTHAQAESLWVIPDTVPVEQAAQAFVNPTTAWRLLEDFAQLNPGDWVIQNAANSAVGQCVIQLAHARGLKTLNIVRDAKWEAPLKAQGGTVVVTEDSDFYKNLKSLTGGAKPALGLNSIGGQSVSNIIRCMGDGGTVVTFGGMTGEPVRFPTRFLIFNDVKLMGFWMDRWMKNASTQARDELMQSVYDALASGTLKCPVDSTYPLSDYAQAVERASSGGRTGKVLFKA